MKKIFIGLMVLLLVGCSQTSGREGNNQFSKVMRNPALTNADKEIAMNSIVEGFLRARGYAGKVPKVIIGSEKDSEGNNDNGIQNIFISQEELNNPNIVEILGAKLGNYKLN